MAKPTASTDKELIQQIKNLKEGLLERATELRHRGYVVGVGGDNLDNFTIIISKTVKIKETI